MNLMRVMLRTLLAVLFVAGFSAMGFAAYPDLPNEVGPIAVSTSGTATSEIKMQAGTSWLGIQLTGAMVGGTFVPQGTINGTDWQNLGWMYDAISGTAYSSMTVNGLYYVDGAGLKSMRVTCTARTSGTATVHMRVAPAPALKPSNRVWTVTSNTLYTFTAPTMLNVSALAGTDKNVLRLDAELASTSAIMYTVAPNATYVSGPDNSWGGFMNVTVRPSISLQNLVAGYHVGFSPTAQALTAYLRIITMKESPAPVQ